MVKVAKRQLCLGVDLLFRHDQTAVLTRTVLTPTDLALKLTVHLVSLAFDRSGFATIDDCHVYGLVVYPSGYSHGVDDSLIYCGNSLTC